jgi:hypothetical protein
MTKAGETVRLTTGQLAKVVRYGGARPSTLRVCSGDCDGLGYIVGMVWKVEGTTHRYTQGLISCPKCQMTGRCSLWETFLRVPEWFEDTVVFITSNLSGNMGGNRIRYIWTLVEASFVWDVKHFFD